MSRTSKKSLRGNPPKRPADAQIRGNVICWPAVYFARQYEIAQKTGKQSARYKILGKVPDQGRKGAPQWALPSELKLGQGHTFVVRACNSRGKSAWSEPAAVEIEATVSPPQRRPPGKGPVRPPQTLVPLRQNLPALETMRIPPVPMPRLGPPLPCFHRDEANRRGLIALAIVLVIAAVLVRHRLHHPEPEAVSVPDMPQIADRFAAAEVKGGLDLTPAAGRQSLPLPDILSADDIARMGRSSDWISIELAPGQSDICSIPGGSEVSAEIQDYEEDNMSGVKVDGGSYDWKRRTTYYLAGKPTLVKFRNEGRETACFSLLVMSLDGASAR
jgi:hypothetical protein